MIVRRRVVVVIALSVMVFTATASVLIGLKDAPAAFAASEGYVITSSSAPTIFSSRVGMDMADALEQMENITGVSPEVFAFSSWNGHSFVVRGVDIEALQSVGPSLDIDPSLGSEGLEDGLCILGERLADRLGMDIPATIPLAGSYAPRIEVVRVVGEFSSGSPLDDEMLVPVDVARRLVGMGPNDASVVRLSTSEPEWLESLLSPSGAMLTIYDLSVSKALLGPGESCIVSVKVRNWGNAVGSATVLFEDDLGPIGEAQVMLNASESSSVSTEYSSTFVGDREITARISGELPVTLSSSVEVVEPYLVSFFTGTVMLGSYLEVRVETYSGEPAEGITVTLSDSSPSPVTTGPDGSCSLLADELGYFELVFDVEGTEFAGMPIQRPSQLVTVVGPSFFPAEFLPSVLDLSLSPRSIKEGDAAAAFVTLENGGSVAGTARIEVLVDSESYASLDVLLGPTENTVVSVSLEGLAPGRRVVQVGDFSAELEVVPWYADNPGLVELVIRYGGTSTLSSASSLPIYQAAKMTEGNVSLALFALGTVAALLATLAIVSVFSKEVHEGRKRLGILRAIGASRRQIRRLVFPQSLVASLAGSAVGVASGLLLAGLLVRSGAFIVFGHVLEFGASTWMVLLTMSGAVAISIVSAVVSAEIAARETTISSIKDLPEQEGPAPDISELLGD